MRRRRPPKPRSVPEFAKENLLHAVLTAFPEMLQPGKIWMARSKDVVLSGVPLPDYKITVESFKRGEMT